ncbi:MAG: hypothetical protein AB7D38_12085 [Sulfurimonas sp.]|uniref:exodeoxyribonuclease X C-terminal domain-containing protein n=1 Tax=Sulfurimonas sp. TaxID=2022749 RepID=UPI003D119F6C
MFTVKAVIIECNTCKARYELKTGDSFECKCTQTTEEDFADISLVPVVYGLKSTLRFGKHKDKTILTVLKEDPGYIEWCLKNITNFSISDTVMQQLSMDMIVTQTTKVIIA